MRGAGYLRLSLRSSAWPPYKPHRPFQGLFSAGDAGVSGGLTFPESDPIVKKESAINAGGHEKGRSYPEMIGLGLAGLVVALVVVAGGVIRQAVTEVGVANNLVVLAERYRSVASENREHRG